MCPGYINVFKRGTFPVAPFEIYVVKHTIHYLCVFRATDKFVLQMSVTPSVTAVNLQDVQVLISIFVQKTD